MRIAFFFAAGLLTGAGPNVPKAREVEVVGLDYAFKIPSELPAGRTTFRFRNSGKQRHEFNIVMLKTGVTIDQFIQIGRENKSRQPMIEGAVGVLFAEPGKLSSTGLTTDLVPGRYYAVQCIFRDSAQAPRHFEMGMYSVLHVRPEAAPTVAAQPADSIIATDYAFEYPRTVAPGRHTLAFRNAGKVRHEVNMALFKRGVTLDSAIAVDKAGGDVDVLIDEGVGVMHARAGEASLGRLEVDFLPGRVYSIVCLFMDNEKSPPHYKLGMIGSIKVTGKAGT